MAADSRRKSSHIEDDDDDDELITEDHDHDDDEEDERPPRQPRNWFRLSVFAFAMAVIFVIGAAAGAYIMRQRDHKNTTIVTVNDSEITKEDFSHRLDIANGGPVINQMVLDELRLQFFKQKGVLASDAQVEEKFKQVSADPKFAANLFKTRETADDVRRTIRLSLSEEALLKQGITVNDADVHAFYQLNTDPRNPNAQYYHPETVLIAVIATPSRADIDQAAAALKGGAAFDSVARQYSRDPSRARGGLLTPIRRNQKGLDANSGLAKTIFGMHPQQDQGPVQIKGAWWIIRCLEHQPEHTDSYDAVKDNCRLATELYKGARAHQASMEADFKLFCQKAAIQAKWPQYTDLITIKKQAQ